MTVYVGANLAHAAKLTAARNGEDLSRPIVEFLTRITIDGHTPHDTEGTP